MARLTSIFMAAALVALCMVAPASADYVLDRIDVGTNSFNYNTVSQAFPGSMMLGVSSQPGGVLLNNPADATISALPDGVYYLYAQGVNTAWPEGAAYLQIFTISGGTPKGTGVWFSIPSGSIPGTFGLWTEQSGTMVGDTSYEGKIWLGYAQGVVDKVHSGTGVVALGPGNGNDIYLVLGIGVQPTYNPSVVPLPGAVILLGSGLLCLGLFRRRKIASNP